MSTEPSSPPVRVCCAECGLLAVRHYQTRELVEVEIGMRQRWSIPVILGTGRKPYEEQPLCVVQATTFDADPKQVHVQVQMERKCDRFFPWRQGFSPKEHLDMIHSERLVQIAEERKRADEERAEERRRNDQGREDELRADQRKREDERDAKQREWQENQNRANRRWQGLLAVLAALAGIGGVFLGKYLSTNQPVIIQTPAEPKAEPKVDPK